MPARLLRIDLCVKEPKLEDRLAGAGGVPETLVSALGALLTSKELDGMFVAAGVSLPAASELIGEIPNIDPLLLHNVRCVFLPGAKEGAGNAVISRRP